MFKKIKEFIEAFKDAYNTINVNKIDAKKAIDDYSKEVDGIVYAAESLKIIFARLEGGYKYFPIKERQDFITKTLDLIRYGRYDDNGRLKDPCGWGALYITESVGVKNNLAQLKKLYKEGRYGEVKVLAKEYSERLEEFYVLYNIIDNPNESKID
jgi:hypothetical protein